MKKNKQIYDFDLNRPHKKRSIFNIVDIFALIGILAVVAFGIWFFANLDTGRESYIYFTVEFREMEYEFAELIEENAEVRDAIRNYFLGNIYTVEVFPMVINSFNTLTNEFVPSIVPQMYDVWITVRARGIETDSALSIEGNEIRVGQEMFIRGRGFAGEGFAVAIRSEYE